MALQVNARLDESDWDRIVAAIPGVSNAERLSELVRQHLGLLEAQRNLPSALALMERTLGPALSAVRELGLRGKGSELAEALGQAVLETAAVILSHAERLRTHPEAAIPELEALLVQRWSRASVHVLRLAALEPERMRNPGAVAPEMRRVFEQTRLLSAATPPAESAPTPFSSHESKP